MRIDCHVHVVGTGTGGTGCWYRPRGLTRIGAPFLVRAVGLTLRDLHGSDFDRVYAERLLAYVRGSTAIDRALLLAHELPYREDGTPLPEQASFYVPNEMCCGLRASTRNFWRRFRSIRPGVMRSRSWRNVSRAARRR